MLSIACAVPGRSLVCSAAPSQHIEFKGVRLQKQSDELGASSQGGLRVLSDLPKVSEARDGSVPIHGSVPIPDPCRSGMSIRLQAVSTLLVERCFWAAAMSAASWRSAHSWQVPLCGTENRLCAHPALSCDSRRSMSSVEQARAPSTPLRRCYNHTICGRRSSMH